MPMRLGRYAEVDSTEEGNKDASTFTSARKAHELVLVHNHCNYKIEFLTLTLSNRIIGYEVLQCNELRGY